MSISEMISIISLSLVVIGALASLFFYFRLAPVLTLKITPTWTDETRQFLLVRYEVENQSRVRAHHLTGQVQMFEHPLQSGGALSHFIPFLEKDYHEKKYGLSMSENRPAWHAPTPIFSTTKQIFPGETIKIEVLYPCSRPDAAVHLGIQVGLKLGLWGRITTRKREPWRQTTSCILVGRKS